MADDIERRVQRIENCLFGDPSDKDDRGMRAELRELVELAKGGSIAFRVVVKIVMWLGGGVVTLWTAWDWIVAHFVKAGQ